MFQGITWSAIRARASLVAQTDPNLAEAVVRLFCKKGVFKKFTKFASISLFLTKPQG